MLYIMFLIFTLSISDKLYHLVMDISSGGDAIHSNLFFTPLLERARMQKSPTSRVAIVLKPLLPRERHWACQPRARCGRAAGRRRTRGPSGRLRKETRMTWGPDIAVLGSPTDRASWRMDRLPVTR